MYNHRQVSLSNRTYVHVRVNVLSMCLCVCLSVCLSLLASAASAGDDYDDDDDYDGDTDEGYNTQLSGDTRPGTSLSSATLSNSCSYTNLYTQHTCAVQYQCDLLAFYIY